MDPGALPRMRVADLVHRLAIAAQELAGTTAAAIARQSRTGKLSLAIALMPVAALAQAPAGGPTASEIRIRATPPGAPVSAAYLKISAGARGADKLIAVKIDPAIAGTVEIHDMLSEGGVMKMRRIEGVEVKPGAPAELKPGGKHIMLMNLKKGLKAGDTVKMVLVFEKAGEVTVDAKVEQIGAASSGQGGHKGH